MNGRSTGRKLVTAILAVMVVSGTMAPVTGRAPSSSSEAATSAERSPADPPDMSQSVVQDREPRPFRRQTDLAISSDHGRAPRASLVATETLRRTEYSETELAADGSYTTTLSVRPMHWQDGSSGGWRTFDDRLLTLSDEDAAAGFGHGNLSGPFALRFGARDAVRADGTLLTLAADGVGLDMRLVGARPTVAERIGDVLIYRSALPGVDLRYALDHERLKEDIILAAPPARGVALELVFDLTLDGLRAESRDDGSISLRRESDDRPVFSLPKPFMSDAAPTTLDARHSPAVAMSLSQASGDLVSVTITPDDAWLRDPARIYPITIDPNFHYSTHENDTTAGAAVMIDQGHSTTNYYGAGSLTVGKNGAGQRLDALIRFPDLDVLPPDVTVVGADLAWDPASGTNNMAMTIHRATSDWTASTVTYATAPSSTNYSTFTSTTGANSRPVGGLVTTWIRGWEPNYGIRLRGDGGIPAGQSVVIPATGAGSPTLSVN